VVLCWTLLRFLETVQGDGELIFPVDSQRDALWYCMGVSLGGHFVDYEKRECYFDSEEFRTVLEACGSWEAERSHARAAGNLEVGAERAGMIRREHNQKGIYWPGYPGWNGAEIQLGIMDGFVMNSASENKEGAWDFLEFLLSKELQDSIDWGFPARQDSFEDYLASSYMAKEDSSLEFGYFIETPQQPGQEDYDIIREMTDRAVYRPAGFYFNDNPVRVILEEETGMYFAGDATLEETVRKIQSRVTLYLNEM